ncbi:GumC family protein [Aquamicrobium segne]|uniref:GumC family protein n=1 Tax=Aquamicrobium segne TaxID=469547 RepID=A0ABW0GXB5_9HYPH
MAFLSGDRSDRSPQADRVDSSIDLYGLGRTLWRRRWTILFCLVAFPALAWFALSFVTPRYSATARILIDPREQRVVQNEIIQQGVGSDMALVDSQIEVIASETVLGRVVRDLDLVSDPEFNPELDPESGSEPASGLVDEAADKERAFSAALAHLAKALEVSRRDNTYVIDITVSQPDAVKTARLANAIAQAYVADQIAFAANSVRDVSLAIRGRLSELQLQLNEAEARVETFKREHNISQTEGQLLGERRLTDLSARQSEALARVNETAARLQVLEEGLETRGYVGATAADAGSAMGALRTRLADARQRLADLQNVLGPRHPRVTAAVQEVAQAETAIREESERLVAAARDDNRIAVDALNSIDGAMQRARDETFATNENLIKLRELEREAQSIRLVYESFLVRGQEITQQEDIAARTARVIAEAGVPVSPSFPPKVPMLLAAIVMGLFVGVLAAILQDLFAGLLGRDPRLVPTTARKGKDTVVDGLMLVTTLGTPEMVRAGALEIAQGALLRGRSAIFVDLAADAPQDDPGLAEIALGEITAFGALKADQDGSLHRLNAGRLPAQARLSREAVSNVLEAIAAEYDDVIVNIGELEAEHSLAARIAAEATRKAALVMRAEKADAQEQRMAQALSNDGVVAVFLIKASIPNLRTSLG